MTSASPCTVLCRVLLGSAVMLQPPDSPDLTPGDLILFQKLKSAVKGHHFESTEDIQRAVTQSSTTSHTLFSRNATSNGSTAEERCVQAQGMYSEGDHTVVHE